MTSHKFHYAFKVTGALGTERGAIESAAIHSAAKRLMVRYAGLLASPGDTLTLWRPSARNSGIVKRRVATGRRMSTEVCVLTDSGDPVII